MYPVVRHNTSPLGHLTSPVQLSEQTTLFPEQGGHEYRHHMYAAGVKREPRITLIYKPTPTGTVSKLLLKMIKSHSVPSGSVQNQGKAF